MPKHITYILFNLLIFNNLAISQQFNFQNYSVTEGLAQSQVYAMLEDSRGYIWMGTRGGGLSRFDGLSFVNFSTRDSLASNYISALHEDQNSDLWIGTDAGISHFNGHTFTNYQLGEKNAVVAAITRDAENRLWVGTNRGLFRQKEDGKFERVVDNFNKIQGQIYAFHWRKNGNLWIGGDFGAVRIQQGENRITKDAKHLKISQVQSFSAALDGTMWIATYGGGIQEWNGTGWRQRFNFRDVPSTLITAMYATKSGDMWIGTQNSGVTIWHPKDSTFTYLTEQDGLVDNDAREIIQDSWDNIWIGTSGGGVSLYSGQQFVHFTKRNGLIDKAVYAIAEDTLLGRWYLGTGKGFSMFDGENFQHFNSENGFRDKPCKALLFDSRQQLWIGTEGKGLTRYDNTGFLTIRRRSGLAGSYIQDIEEDTLGNIWIATNSGISRIERDSAGNQFIFKNFTAADTLPDLRINDLHLDTLHRMWFAMRKGGIGCILNDSTIQYFNKSNGLPSNNIRILTEDADGRLWAGTAANGIAKANIYADTIQFQSINARQGLASNNIYLLQTDAKAQLWVGTEKGVDKLALDADGNINKYKHYGRLEGFLGVETCQDASLEDHEGNLWFGTMKGLMRYNPRTILNNPVPPKVAITQVRLFYDPLQDTPYAKWLGDWHEIADSLVFPHDENHLGFAFMGINHSNPEKVRYQWQLEGFEEAWSPPSTLTNASYPNLSPGTYTFKVRAENEDGIFNEIPAIVRFEILRPFWQEWWFIASVIGAILLLIGLIFSNQINAIRKRAKQQEERLKMEKNLLQLEQKALQLQMNPHFIFNALNSIQSQIGKQDNRTARYQLAKFSKLMRAILENSRSTQITLDQEVETLQNYLTLEQFSRGNTFDFRIETPPDLDIEDTFLPPMMVQPFVENAIVHGVAHLKTKGHIQVQFIEEKGLLKCVIEDNGIGRAAAAKMRSQLEDYHKSTALKVTQERLDILQPDGAKSLMMEDILDENGAVIGTQVVLYLIGNQ